MLLDLLDVVPAHGRLILPVREDTVLPAKARLVVLLGLMILNLLLVVPSDSRLVLPVRLHSVLAPKARCVVLLASVLLQSGLLRQEQPELYYIIHNLNWCKLQATLSHLIFMADGRLVHPVGLHAVGAAVAPRPGHA